MIKPENAIIDGLTHPQAVPNEDSGCLYAVCNELRVT